MTDVYALAGLVRRDAFTGIDRNSQTLIDRENRRVEAMHSSHSGAQTLLYQELCGRNENAGSSLPLVNKHWLYYDRWQAGDDYVRHCRRSIAGGSEQLLLDENAIARGRSYFDPGDWGLDSAQERLAWSVDTTGDEYYRIFVKDVISGDVVDVSPEFCDSCFEWGSADDLYYARLDDDGRVSSIHRHLLGTNWASDETLFAETDDAFSVGVSKSRCHRWLLIESGGFDATETRLIDLRDTRRGGKRLHLVRKRTSGLEYYLDVCGERLVAIANTGSEFELYRGSTARLSHEDWVRVGRDEPDWFIESADAFSSFYVLSERLGAQTRLRVFDYADVLIASLMPDRTFETISLAENIRPETRKLRVDKVDAVRPEQTLCWDIDANRVTELWDEDIGEEYDPDDYGCRRVFVRSHDGTPVAISLVWKRNQTQAGGNPCVVQVYGAYEDVCDLEFDADRLGLLKAGVIFATVHVRGGGEGGREWYEQGRRDRKINGVTDFVVAARGLFDMALVQPGGLVLQAESAGALIAAAALNEEPALFSGAVLDVPFVDMVGSLSDEDLPTTIADREEFGDPTIEASMRYIARLSPFDNISSKTLPPVLLSGGLSDERVHVREPLKWAQRVRQRSETSVYVAIDTESGHHGPMGRRREMSQLARTHAFILDCLSLRPSDRGSR